MSSALKAAEERWSHTHPTHKRNQATDSLPHRYVVFLQQREDLKLTLQELMKKVHLISCGPAAELMC